MEITVIIPCYNTAQFIGECLESVAAQTKKPAEIIVIDDGSTDSSLDVISRAPIPVQLLHTERKGGAGARNAGIKAAAGQWLAFLDADDIWFPNHLERASQIIMRTGAGAYINHYNHIRAGRLCTRKSKVPSEVTGIGIDDYITLFRRYGHFVGMSACLVERRRALEIGGLLESQLRRHDIEFWLRTVHETPWVFDPLATSSYRKDSPGSLSSNSADAGYYGLTAFLRHRSKAKDLAPYDAVLQERARSALTRSFILKDQDMINRSYSAAFNYLSPTRKILFRLLRRAPQIFPVLRMAHLV